MSKKFALLTLLQIGDFRATLVEPNPSKGKDFKHSEKKMVNWKKAVVIGSMTAGALMLIKGHRPAGAALATVGLVVLASEYPEQFEHVWDNAPEYISRGAQIFSTVQKLAERFADQVEQGGVGNALREIGSEYAG